MIENIYGECRDITMKPNQAKDYDVWAFDTETPDYTIRLLTIANPKESFIFDVSGKTILDTFIEFFEKLESKNIVCWAHNLTFDMSVLMNQDLVFKDSMQLLLPECTWGYRGCKIYYNNDTPFFGEILFPSGKIVYLRDTFSFFGRIKLAKLAENLKVGSKIKIRQEMHGEKNAYKTKEYRNYAKEDARLTAAIGQVIMDFHDQMDVNLCVSGPQMASMVFRKDFIPSNAPLIKVPKEFLQSFELSYHGGKNGLYVDTPSYHKNIYLYDINSAYPDAMTKIPSFNMCTYFQIDNPKFQNSYEGIYQISGKNKCKYHPVFTHDFKPCMDRFERLWITSYELRSCIKHDCIGNLKIHSGIFVEEHSRKHSIRNYAQTYYKLKQVTPKDSALYPFYKITMLNSLYGKFIQRKYDEELDYSIRGSIYNPAIASLITGHCRAHLHELEHRGNAIHSATDSVFTFEKMNTGKDLGEVSLEGKGNLKLIRNKVYIFYDQSGDIQKYAMHGFHGTITQLEEIWKTHKNEYEYQKMPQVKETFLHKKLGLKLYGMNKMRATLNIDWENLK